MTDNNSYRIVIADDEGLIRMGLKTMVQALGHKVIATARTGEEAIEKVTLFSPDLLLLDIKMPGLDGLSVARQLAQEAPLPIIILTAYSRKELVDQAIEALVMGYLVKPVDEAKLAPSIDMAIARFGERAAAESEVNQLRERLADRGVIHQARRLLMSQGLTEHEAYHMLQAGARRRQISLADQAEYFIKRGGRL